MKNIPANTKAMALVLDSENIESGRRLVRNSLLWRKNIDVKNALCSWLESVHKYPFIAVGFCPGRAGFVGGFATDWDAAKVLCSMVKIRFDSAASAVGLDASSAWVPYLEPNRYNDLTRLLAKEQQCEGRA